MSEGIEAYKLFRQLEERKKRVNPYKFYDKDELIDEILKLEDKVEELMELYTTERHCKDDYKSIIKEVREIFKDYGEKEDIVGYTMYNITGEMLIKLLEILNKTN